MLVELVMVAGARDGMSLELAAGWEIGKDVHCEGGKSGRWSFEEGAAVQMTCDLRRFTVDERSCFGGYARDVVCPAQSIRRWILLPKTAILFYLLLAYPNIRFYNAKSYEVILILSLVPDFVLPSRLQNENHHYSSSKWCRHYQCS